MNLNKAFILGNLTRDPELRQTPSGQVVVNFGVATNRVWFDQTGNKQTQTEFHNVVVWGRKAEVAKQYLSKGRLVLIEGRLATRSWQNQNGEKRTRTEVIAENMQLGPRFAAANFQATSLDQEPEKPAAPLPEVQLDEIGAPSEPSNANQDALPSESEKDEIRVEDIPF